MSEENPAPPAAYGSAALGDAAAAGLAEMASASESAAAAATNGDTEMKDASAPDSAMGDLAAAAVANAEGGEQPPRRTRSSSFDVRDESTAAAASADAPAPAPAEEQATKKTFPEATRVSARVSSKGADRDLSAENAMSSLLDAAEIRTPTVVAGAGPTGMTFLDTLSEEERRTRLRHVPSAEGFKALHRSEVRRDLALARSILTGTGGASGVIASSKASAPKGGRRSSGLDAGAGDALSSSRHDGMDIDEEGAMSDTSEAELASVSSRSGRDVAPTGPSPAFVPPVDTDPVPGSLPDASEPASEKQKGLPVYPHIIESTVAFDPPRLPHSDAKSKKNRFSRWQAHPKEIEKDLETYRKTVADTRDHLHRNEKEAERFEIVGGHLRSHFFAHLRCLRDEGLALERDLGAVQAQCVEKAEVTKTRSTDADGGIGAKAMHDVLTALKAKAGRSNPAAAGGKPWYSIGIGGLPASSGEEKKEDGDSGLASGWILPGDNVETPLGKGVVVDVSAPSLIEVSDETDKEKPKAEEKEAATDAAKAPASDATSPPKSHGFGSAPAEGDAKEPAKKDGDAPEAVSSEASAEKDEGDKPTAVTSSEAPSDKVKEAASVKKEEDKPSVPPKKVELKLVPAKVRVRITSDGFVKPFDLADLKILEDPSTYSDEQLIERWKKMVETSKLVGCCANVGAMDDLTNGTPVSRATSIASSGGDGMEVDDSAAQQQTSEDSKAKLEEYGLGYADLSKTKMSTNKTVPVGSGMLLSPGLRGTSLATIPFNKLEEYLDPMVYAGTGVLGRNDNPGVPPDIKQWEDVRYELVTLKGRANHLRNELHRQRRIRMLNERTRHVLDERAERVEGLLAEMKSDLITLKERLEHELDELGMDSDHAAEILAAYIKERDSAIASEEFPGPPKKRPKPESKAAAAPRVSRRSRANQGSDDNDDTGSVKGAPDAAEDDGKTRKKRNRSDESVDGAPKPKRGGYRRQ